MQVLVLSVGSTLAQAIRADLGQVWEAPHCGDYQGYVIGVIQGLYRGYTGVV